MDVKTNSLQSRIGNALSDLADRFPFSVWVLILTLIAITLRLLMLLNRSIWYDEAFSILFSREGPTAMLMGTLTPVDGVAADVHPLLYYSLLWGWMKLFGQSIVAVRMLSVAFGALLLIAFVLLARRLFNKPVAIMAGLLYAVSPFQVHYALEARMYVLLALLATLASLSLYIAVTENARVAVLWFGFFSALALYSHILAVFFLVPLALVIYLQNRSRSALLRIAQGSLVALLLYTPWLLRLPAQISKVQQSYWIPRPGPGSLLQTLLAFTSDLPIDQALLPIVLAASLLIFVFLVVEYRHVRKSGADSRQFRLVVALTLLPLVLLFGISQFRPIYIVRGLLPSGVFFLMLVSWFLYHGRSRAVGTLCVCLIITFGAGMYSLNTYNGFPYGPFRSMNAALREVIDNKSVILHSNKISMLPAYYDDPTLPHRYLQDPPGSGSDTLARPTQEVLKLLAEHNPQSAVKDAVDVYLVVFRQEIDDYERLGYQKHPTIAALEEKYRIREINSWDDLFVYAMELDE